MRRRREPGEGEDAHCYADALTSGSTALHSEGRVPRWLWFVLGLLAVLGLSGRFAYLKVEARRRERRLALGDENPVAALLESEALLHIELPVSDLHRSSMFYSDVLGAREVAAEDFLGSGSGAASSPWQLLSFGNSLVRLVEVHRKVPPISSVLALRMSVNTQPADFLRVVQERIDSFGELLKGVACKAAARAGPGVTCYGPDGEVVEFWEASVRAAKAMEKARKAWVTRASDSRGRDIFE